MDDNFDYIHRNLANKFENWFKKLDYNSVYKEDWYKQQENIVVKHLYKKNTTVTKEVYKDIVPEFGTNYCVPVYSYLIYSAFINDKDYYTDLLNLAQITHSGATDLSYKENMSPKILDTDCKRLLDQYEKNIVKARSVLFPNVNFDSDFANDSNFKKQLFDVMKKMPMFKQICKQQFIEFIEFIESKRNKKSYTKARVGTVILGISFVISLILAWQVSIYILIASAILLAILIIYLIALKKNGFECTKIFCCCMDVEDEPQKENSKDNNLINPRLNKAEKLID